MKFVSNTDGFRISVTAGPRVPGIPADFLAATEVYEARHLLTITVARVNATAPALIRTVAAIAPDCCVTAIAESAVVAVDEQIVVLRPRAGEAAAVFVGERIADLIAVRRGVLIVFDAGLAFLSAADDSIRWRAPTEQIVDHAVSGDVVSLDLVDNTQERLDVQSGRALVS